MAAIAHQRKRRATSRLRRRAKVLLKFVPALSVVLALSLLYLQFVFTVKFIPTQQEQSMLNMNNSHDEPCALLFFGVVKSFEDLVLPSIRTNIIDANPTCDVFLHTYDLKSAPINPRNGKTESIAQPLDVSQAYQLTNNVVIEDVDNVYKKRMDAIERVRESPYEKWGECCVSSDNMIKQWHSINGVWELMENYRQLHHKSYNRVGLFRSDVYYVNPIKIDQSDAVVANFSLYGGYNDRIFTGLYQHAKVWASKRFEFMETFEDEYMWENDRFGYHSETYLHNLLTHYHVPVTFENICLWRVRSGPRVKVTDCMPPQHADKLAASLDIHDDFDDQDDLSVEWIEYALDYLPLGYKVFSETIVDGPVLVDFYASRSI